MKLWYNSRLMSRIFISNPAPILDLPEHVYIYITKFIPLADAFVQSNLQMRKFK